MLRVGFFYRELDSGKPFPQEAVPRPTIRSDHRTCLAGALVFFFSFFLFSFFLFLSV